MFFKYNILYFYNLNSMTLGNEIINVVINSKTNAIYLEERQRGKKPTVTDAPGFKTA